MGLERRGAVVSLCKMPGCWESAGDADLWALCDAHFRAWTASAEYRRADPKRLRPDEFEAMDTTALADFARRVEAEARSDREREKFEAQQKAKGAVDG